MTYQQIIDDTVQMWAGDLIRSRIRAIDRKKLKASGDLRQIRADIVRAAIENAAIVHLVFNEYGRYHDMKSYTMPDDIPVDKLIEWIERKGLATFKRKHLRLYGKIPSDPVRLKNAIAWGIKKGRHKRRRRAWYSRGTYGSLYSLYDRLLVGLADVAIQKQKSTLKDGLTN